MAMRCTSCGRVLDDYVDADEIFEQVSGWVYGGVPDGGVVEIEEELIDRHGIFSCAACLWKESTGGSATCPMPSAMRARRCHVEGARRNHGSSIPLR